MHEYPNSESDSFGALLRRKNRDLEIVEGVGGLGEQGLQWQGGGGEGFEFGAEGGWAFGGAEGGVGFGEGDFGGDGHGGGWQICSGGW